MVQDQLLDYVSSQLKLGIPRETIKAALLGAGWAAGDVEETIKKAEMTVKPAAGAGAAGAKPMTAAMPSEPQSVKVSDLISASGSATSFFGKAPSSAAPVTAAAPMASKPAMPAAQPMKPMASAMPVAEVSKPKTMAAAMPSVMPAAMPMGASAMMEMPSEKKKSPIMMIVGIVIILALGGLSGYLYMQNTTLSGKVGTLGGASADVMAQIATLTGQVKAQNASNTALMEQVASLQSDNALLKANLSFAQLPLAAINRPTSTETVSIAGALSGGKTSYLLTTPYGVAVYVQNSKDAKVIAALQPLLATSTQVMLTGTHLPGSQYITVTDVNGVSLSAPAAAATSTATSTASTTSSTSQ